MPFELGEAIPFVQPAAHQRSALTERLCARRLTLRSASVGTQATMTVLARALLAYSIHEHQLGYARRVDVWMRPGSFVVQDDGRGMGLDRTGYVEGMLALLVGCCDRIELHGVGLSVIAASTPRLAIESRKGGNLWKQSFTCGIADAPPECEPCGPATGTRISLDGLALWSEADVEDFSRHVSSWRERHPSLSLIVH